MEAIDRRNPGLNPSIEWIVAIDPFEGTVTPDRVRKIFDVPWRQANGSPRILGLDPEAGVWTPIDAAELPRRVCALELGWTYLPEESPLGAFTSEAAGTFLRETEARAKNIGAIAVRAHVTPQEGEARARHIDSLRREIEDPEVIIALAADDGRTYEGRSVWTTATEIGLEWGMGDLFHWVKPEDPAAESLFSVATSTEPGYFIPEEIARGQVALADLLFTLSIPRTKRPAVAAEVMIRAAKYVRYRLGGSLLWADVPLDEPALFQWIARVERRLEAARIVPGSEEARRIF